MQDVAGKKGAAADTTASESGRIDFSELLSKKIGTRLQPTANVGGINPKQMSGVGISGITPNMPKGNIIKTGNPLDLSIEGGGYFAPSANSGDTVTTGAMTNGAGTVHGGSLEKSSADVTTEFVNMIQAKNGFQANVRTISAANEILREMSNLFR